jgi:2-polyprenyl-3-methyl-5-hydroxy-6-metoxy-1,4-benzoquinol methylase
MSCTRTENYHGTNHMDDVARLDSLPATEDIGVISLPCCPLCGNEGRRLYVSMVDWLFGVPGEWGIRNCAACSIAWLDPQPVARDIGKLYRRYYTHNANTPVTRLSRLRNASLQYVLARMGYSVDRPKGLVARLLSHVRTTARASALEVLDLPASGIGTLLDVGCGNGGFIARMRSLGWSVSGLDPDPGAVSHARNQGLEIWGATISEVPDTAKYDVITLNHVVEHAVDPIGLLRECGKRLRPVSGRLILTTPNIASLGHQWFDGHWRGLEVPRHLILFSPNSLRECIKRAGLRLQSLSTETRLARMIYVASVCAKQGGLDVGEQTKFKVRTKFAGYLFQVFEDWLLHLKADLGEEILCVCTSREA